MARKAKIPNHIKKRLARKEAKRKEAIRTIREYLLIVCEGQKTEPNYFEGFQRHLPPGVLESNRLEIIGEGKNTLSLLQAVKIHRDQREKEMGRTFDQVWIVFDKDDFPANNLVQLRK